MDFDINDFLGFKTCSITSEVTRKNINQYREVIQNSGKKCDLPLLLAIANNKERANRAA